MDTIYIRDLQVTTLIGTYEDERLAPQKLLFNLEIFTDMTKAAASDDLRDAVDYSLIEELVRKTAESSSFALLEALAGKIIETVKNIPGVERVAVTVDKPAAAKYARSIAIRMER